MITPAHTNIPTNDPLAGLRDIHLPAAIGWWPPAPGWWMLLGFIILCIAVSYFWLRWRTAQKNKPLTFSQADMIATALLEFDSIDQHPASDTDAREVVGEISRLLRRCAIQLNTPALIAADSNTTGLISADPIAGLTGQTWLAWLDEHWDRHDFTQGVGLMLIEAPYRQSIAASGDLAELFRITRTWLEQQR